MSESENSETDEREKYRVDVKISPESDACEAAMAAAVRPILHHQPSNKQPETAGQKTANIEIERSARNKRKPKHQRDSDTSSSSAMASKAAESENNYSEGEEPFESKNDLIFNLDI